MKSTNTDIVELIAQHVDPSPVLFGRLAAVNKDFYAVFTSDRTWAPLDVYNLKTGIYQHYLETTRSTHGLAEFCWTRHELMPSFAIQNVKNKYSQLGYYLTHAREINATDEQLLIKLVEIDPRSVSRFSEKLWKYEKVIIRACLRNLSVLGDAPNKKLSFSKGFARQAIEGFNSLTFGRAFDTVFWMEQEFISSKVVEDAIKRDPRRLFNHWTRILLKYMPTKMIENLACDREKLLYAIEGHAEALEYYPQFWKDKEVYLTALSTPQYGTPFTHIELGMPAPVLPGLDQWDDLEVATAAIKCNPIFFNSLSKELKSDTSLIRLALQHPKLVFDLDMFRKIDRAYIKEPETLGHLVDNNILNYMLQHPEFEYIYEDLDPLQHDREWMRLRIRTRANAFTDAADSLQQDKGLFLLALKSSFPGEFEPVPLHKSQALGYDRPNVGLQLMGIPSNLYDDKEVIDAAINAGFMYLVPRSRVSKEDIKRDIAKQGLDRYPRYNNDLEMVKAALDANPVDILFVLPDLVKSAEFKKYVKENIYELGLLWILKDIPELLVKELGPGPNWRSISRERAMSVFLKRPYLYDQLPKSITKDIQFNIEACRKDWRMFGYLTEPVKNRKDIQSSLRSTGLPFVAKNSDYPEVPKQPEYPPGHLHLMKPPSGSFFDDVEFADGFDTGLFGGMPGVMPGGLFGGMPGTFGGFPGGQNYGYDGGYDDGYDDYDDDDNEGFRRGGVPAGFPTDFNGNMAGEQYGLTSDLIRSLAANMDNLSDGVLSGLECAGYDVETLMDIAAMGLDD